MADRRVIQLLFKIGKCLAFTPFSLTGSKPSRFQKIYKSAILTLYTAVTIYTWYTRMIFYVDLTKIQLVLKVLIDVNVYAHNFYTLVVVKQEHWFTLMCCLANIDNQAKQDSYLLTALVPLVTVGGVIITELCYWYYSFGWYSLCFFFLRSCPQLLPIFLQRFDWRHLENDLGKVQVPNCTGSQSGTFVKVKTQLSRVDMCDSRF
jgi:hypothetical protein